MDFSDQRLSYDKGSLDDGVTPNNPFELLNQWVNEAIAHNAPEPYAISLATCGADNQPAVRTVLVREINEEGLVFYTNYLSNKAQDIEQNPFGECLFFWHDMQRQIRIRGPIAKVSAEETDRYFKKRPYESQLGAWVSQPQSGEVDSRQTIEETFLQLKSKFTEGNVPTPDFWGGYELKAKNIEFWQGRASRLHDRIEYSLIESNQWNNKRLLP